MLLASSALFLACSNAQQDDVSTGEGESRRRAPLRTLSEQDASTTKTALGEASTQPPDEVLDLVAVLRDPADFDFSRLHGADQAEIAELIEERKTQLEPYVEELTGVIERLDGTIIAVYWTEPTLRMHLRARDLPELAAQASVRYVMLVTEGGQPANQG